MNNKLIVITLTVVTAVWHLTLGLRDLGSSFGIPFILNGAGYLVLLAALYIIPQLASYRALTRYALMAFAAVTIVAYFIVNDNPIGSGLVTKVVEVALVAALWLGRDSA